MAIINGNHCCNCLYWDGPRKVSAFKDKAEVKSLGDLGVCLNAKSASTKGKSKRADQATNCNQFRKWDHLK
jgi:hypothetical protein